MKRVDLLIVGAGPAGLTAAQYGARAGLNVLVLEQESVGGQALLIDNLENYPGNMAGVSGREITVSMHKQAMDFGAQFDSAEALAISAHGTIPPSFNVVLSDKEPVNAKSIILAMGAKHKTLGVPGENEFIGRGVSYCAACDGPFFRGKKIFIVGGGDAACDEARFLGRLSSNINLIHRRGVLKAQKALAKRVLEDPAVTVRFNTSVTAIEGTSNVEAVELENTKTGEKSREAADAVFIFTGIDPQNHLALSESLPQKPKLDKSGFIITDQNMATAVPGIFAAGDVRSSPFRQVIVAAGEGAVAAHSAAEYIEMLRGK
ncbi:thioredoxin reductase [Spirochaetia bacterium]|nr:thioredoxin reductase [Spirochaetia bacterium]